MSDQIPPTPEQGDAVPGFTPPPADSTDAPTGAYPPPPPPDASFAAPPSSPAEFNIGTALSYAWSKFTANPAPFILLTLIVGVGTAVVWGIGFAIIGVVTAGVYNSDSVGVGTGALITISIVTAVFVALAIFVALLLNMSLIRASLDTVRGGTVSVGSSFRTTNFPQYLVLQLVLVVIYLVVNVVISMVPFIGPILSFVIVLGVSVVFFFAPYLVIDQGMPAIEALKTSYAMAMSNIGQAILAVIVLGLVSAVGVIICGIGSLVTVPLALIGGAYAYLFFRNEPVAP